MNFRRGRSRHCFFHVHQAANPGCENTPDQWLFPRFGNPRVGWWRDELAASITMFRGYSSGSVIACSDSRKRTRLRAARFDSESQAKKKKEKRRRKKKIAPVHAPVFALHRVWLVRAYTYIYLKARLRGVRDKYKATRYPWMRRPTEEDRWAEAWFFLVIKNYAPRPACVKARGFVNIFSAVYAFGLAKRRDKVSAYFPGSPFVPTPKGGTTNHHPLFSFIPFCSSFLFVLSSTSHSSHPLVTIIFPDFPVGNSNFFLPAKNDKSSSMRKSSPVAAFVVMSPSACLQFATAQTRPRWFLS